MKNKYILPFIVLIAVLTACNEDKEIETPLDAEVTFNTSVNQGSLVEDLKSTSTDPLYDRDGAPAEVAGLNITAKNLSFTGYDMDQDFYFADEDNVNNPIIMSVKAGTNVFNAVGIPANSEPVLGTKTGMAGMNHWFRDQGFQASYPEHRRIYVDDPVHTTIEARAEQYGKWILEHVPLYAEYASDEITKSISSSGTNTVEFDLTPQNGRINFILEMKPESYLDYGVYITLREQDGSVVMYDHDDDPTTDDIEYVIGQAIYSIHYSASAWVFNGRELTDGRYADITIRKRPISGQSVWDWKPLVEAGELTVNVEEGKNINFLIYLNDIDLEVNTGVSSTTFEPLVDENTGMPLYNE